MRAIAGPGTWRRLAPGGLVIVSFAAPVPTASMRHLKDRGLEGLSKEDPFGEKAAWDTDGRFAKWHGINVEAMTDAMDAPEVQSAHFGPDWARLSTLARVATRKAKSEAPRGEASEYVAKPRFDVEGKEISATSQSARWTGAKLDSLPQTYEDLVNSGTLDEAANLTTEAGGGGAVIGVDENADLDDVREILSPTSPSVPESLRDAMAAATSAAPVPSPTAEPAVTAAHEGVVVVPEGISKEDPLQWNTAELVAFLRHYAAVDDDMAQAFEMVRVDGEMLLNRVLPCNMFKEIRKWHNKGRTAAPNITADLVQETIYLCYPYGR